ncbi:PREDICTED: APC membrane recruitment protein 1 [Chaetura pelagica]|uniref:APC membrane recruitment protein 1 n=1 Tax=Chaetura pelagica TaxID=8897 RepID=UPI000523E951|nr:PREDICTED: APC membrane recruitment protein 1 [Chaetura pelagica]
MERGCTEEPTRPGWQPGLCGQPEGSDQQREESGAGLPEQGNGSMTAAEPQQPPGKLKKTAFKLFGGKRSICTLPSFFGGRNKGQGKAASKKGLSKCKTHDGLSGAAYDKGDGVQLESPLEGSRDSHPCPLPSSQSAHVAIDTSAKFDFGQQDSSPPGSIEGCEKKPNGDKSFPRPKKGLKGFFNSIRRHRKSKVPECEKTQLPEWTGDSEQAGKAPGVGAESQEAMEGRELGPVPLAMACPGCLEDKCSVGTATHCGETAEPGCLTADEGTCVGDMVVMPRKRDTLDKKSETDAVACTEFDHGNLLLDFPPDFIDNDPPCLHSGDLLDLILGDATSLKSFDSLTGCGDDIAEPDITESTISVERSREAAKRSSCLVTYQGGGEEMAIPEEAEEYLHQIWNGNVAGDRTYEAQVSSSSLETHASHEVEAHPYLGDAMDGVDLLTPQSDQQESAPNSDEGYYDSTTPGPEDEAGDGLSEIKKDRLPRDSYSGDALYEFDTLMSPSHGDESLFEGKISRPGIFSYFLDFCLPAEKSLNHMMDQKRGVMETEERLAAIQKELLYWELQREPVLKRLDLPDKEKCPREKQCIECKTRAASSMGKNQSGLGSEQVASHTPNRGVHTGVLVARAENPEWRDFPGTLSQPNCYNSQKAQGSCLIQLTKNNSGFNSDPDCGLFGGSILGGIAPAKAGMFPGYRLPEPECGSGEETTTSKSQVGSECEPEHAVSFSQALVEFASSGTLFSSLSESLGSSASGSSFTQNLPALPTMVTFDVVDVEQEGEGECEQHPEMNAGEDIAEAFDDGYGQKESLAECDERMSPGYSPGSFQSCNWGVASLPRHMRLHGLNPSLPAPLSVDRRSRSLDTESLEVELADSQVVRSSPQPSRLWSKRESSKKDSGGARRSRSKEEGELVALDGGLSWPGLQHLPHDTDMAAGGMKHWGFAPAAAMESTWEPPELQGTMSPFLSLSQSVAGQAPERRPQELEVSRLLRPSDLPLQPDTRQSRETASSCRYHGDLSTKKLSHFLPLGETESELPTGFSFSCSPEKRTKCKPIGIAQGMPQHPNGSTSAVQSPECCGEPLKGRAPPGRVLPTGCQSTAMNVTKAK